MQTNDLNETIQSESAVEKTSMTDATVEAPQKKKKDFNKLAFLHFIRFILAFSIILWHFPFGTADNFETHPFLFSIRAITIYGGNQAFMLISGMMFYLAYYAKLTNDKMKATDFLKKRAIRIYPIVIASMLVTYILSLIIHFNINVEENINLIDLIKDMFFFGARLFGGLYGIYNGPIWFLAPLCISYLISVLIIILTKKKKSVYWFLIPLAIGFFAGLGSDFIVPAIHFQTIAIECFNFFLGFFFMIFLTKFDEWNSIVKIPLRIICLAVAIIFLYAFYKTKTQSPLGGGEIIGNLFCWIPLIICLYGLKFNIIFDNVVFKILGGVSFHIFIWHNVVYKMWYVHFALQQKPVYGDCVPALIIFITLVLVVSAVSYTVYELMRKYKVINKLKTKINKLNNTTK